MVWVVGENRLTTDQLRAVEALPTESRLIVGGPGSGKTLVLLHRARYLSDRYRVPAERFRIIVYTNVLRDYIQSACHELGVPLDNVLTFDHWCRLYYERHIGRRIPWNHQAKRPDFEHMRKAVAGHVATLRPQLYDFVLVDEGQDLEVEAFAVLRTISKHVTVSADRKQQIYENGAAEDQIAAALGLPRRNLSLLAVYRCSPYIVPLASAFIDSREEQDVFKAQTQAGPLADAGKVTVHHGTDQPRSGPRGGENPDDDPFF